MNNDFFNDPKLNSLNPTKKKIIKEIVSQSKTSPLEKLLPQIMQINQELNRRNMAFTKEESALLMEAMESNMSQEERNKFNMIKSFLM